MRPDPLLPLEDVGPANPANPGRDPQGPGAAAEALPAAAAPGVGVGGVLNVAPRPPFPVRAHPPDSELKAKSGRSSDARLAILQQQQAAVADMSNELSQVCKCLETLPAEHVPRAVRELNVRLACAPSAGRLAPVLLMAQSGKHASNIATPSLALALELLGPVPGPFGFLSHINAVLFQERFFIPLPFALGGWGSLARWVRARR